MRLGPAIAYSDVCTIHEATGYTPFYVTFGRSPLLPVDIMLGVHRQKEQEVPVYVTDTHRALQKAYTNVRQCLQAHQRNKSKLCHSSLPCW